MSFKAIDSKLLEKYTQIWKKVKGFLNIKFSSEPIYEDNDKYIKKKIKLYGDKVDFIIKNYQNKIFHVNACH